MPLPGFEPSIIQSKPSHNTAYTILVLYLPRRLHSVITQMATDPNIYCHGNLRYYSLCFYRLLKEICPYRHSGCNVALMDMLEVQLQASW